LKLPKLNTQTQQHEAAVQGRSISNCDVFYCAVTSCVLIWGIDSFAITSEGKKLQNEFLFDSDSQAVAIFHKLDSRAQHKKVAIQGQKPILQADCGEFIFFITSETRTKCSFRISCYPKYNESNRICPKTTASRRCDSMFSFENLKKA
jgi:hypothetical protein